MDPNLAPLVETALEMSNTFPGGALSRDSSVSLLAGGSQRCFFRLDDGIRSLIALIQPGGGEEFMRYVDVGRFLFDNQIAVPEFYASDNRNGILLMEDLGTVDLETALKRADQEAELSFYRDGIDILFDMQTSVTSALLRSGLAGPGQTDGPGGAKWVFDRDVLMGETKYFEDEFIRGFCDISTPTGFDEERSLLADRIAEMTMGFMHRDFQSRNIMVKDGRFRIIDFQSAHYGPGLYDTASFLKDPYHPVLPGTRRTLLMELYYRLDEAGVPVPPGFEQYYGEFLLAGIQRNMQALAAFVKLGFRMEKPGFIEAIPAGLDCLEEGIDEYGGFDAVREVVKTARRRLKDDSVIELSSEKTR